MKLEKLKVIKIGSSYGFLIPAAFVNKGILKKGESYDIEIEGVLA